MSTLQRQMAIERIELERHRYIQAALTGLLASASPALDVRQVVDDSLAIADRMMEALLTRVALEDEEEGPPSPAHPDEGK